MGADFVAKRCNFVAKRDGKGRGAVSFKEKQTKDMKDSKLQKMLCLMAVAFVVLALNAQERREKTTFQTQSSWRETMDVRSDVVIVYGANDKEGETFADRVESWRRRGYTTHFMTGIAWGRYADYFDGRWDGATHFDEGQCSVEDTIWHGRLMPYIVPTENYLRYFKARHLKPAIDAGIDAIYLEEPEFWTHAGYSDAFKREWEAYYGFAWRPQHETAENTYLSNKLKYHLYYRALQEAFEYCKTYGKEKGLDVRCYVPTHSLVNYSVWGIVSPEASLASLPCVDGYIAQVWTGTSRAPQYYNGVMRERVFENAFLEYGCMESMTAPTGRKVFFLTDPIEDGHRDWADYKRNYEATFTAQLLYPRQGSYEVMPWPERIYEGLYSVSEGSEEKTTIPRFYSTQMQVMVNALNDMPETAEMVSGTQGVRVLMGNSLMFQRSIQPVEGYDDPQLANFYGLAMPLLKRGVPVGVTHIENVGYRETWEGVRVLMMTYSNMKPLTAEAHQHIAEWVRNGGRLIYSGRDDDAYQRVSEWWRQGDMSYDAPSQHLFEVMGLPREAAEGVYECGKGRVYVLRHDPKEFVMEAGGDSSLVACVREAYGEGMEEKNSFVLRRGKYVVAAVMDESVSEEPLRLRGRFVDLFSPELPVLTEKTLGVGEQTFLLDLDAVECRETPQVLAAASRQYAEVREEGVYAFVSKSPARTTNVMRVLLPRAPQRVVVSAESEWEWDEVSGTVRLRFENSPEGVGVRLEY